MLPIVTRELRVASKRRATYRLRWIVALIGSICVVVATTAANYSIEAGQFVFWTASALMTFACASAGLLLTADSISREKRDGTLGLLFLTRLTSADVVLGKLAVGTLTGCVVLVPLPFLAFSLCLGGVTVDELWQMSAALIFLLAYSLTFGIFVSTVFRKESLITLVYVFFIVGPFASTPLAIMKWKVIPLWLARINPLVPVSALGDRYGVFYTRELAASALIFQSIAIPAMLLITFIILPWTVRSAGTMALPRLNFSRNHPIFALVRRHGSAVALCALCVASYFLVKVIAPTSAIADLVFVLVMALLPKIFVLWRSSGAIAIEKQSGALESLLTTPLTAGEVLHAKMHTIKTQLAPTLLFALLALWSIATNWWGSTGHITAEATIVLAAMIALLIDIHTVGWVGLWLGVTARDRRRALIGAGLVGLILPWIPGLIALGLLIWMFDAPTWLNDPQDIIPLAVISANIVSFGIACLAMARVHDKFRSTGTDTWAGRGGAAAA